MARDLSIEVLNVSKSFRIPAPEQSLPSRIRAGNPFRPAPGRQLAVLRDVSFDVEQGEFFGVVGRNGSGKSTLLKLIAGIYGVDTGRVRVAGRLAPFLELGVGFNPEAAARENVIMNGVMMGLTTKEARTRYESIVDFAGLGDFTDLKLKNYSSGMRVRLGFAVMCSVDADLLLVDEVLAVGDAEFKDRCEDAFDRMHAEGRTIILVTHSMDAINAHCQRALMLHEGRLDTVAEPGEVARRYAEVNLTEAVARHPEVAGEQAQHMAEVLRDPPFEVEDAWLEDAASRERIGILEQAQSIELRARVRCCKPTSSPAFAFRLIDSHERKLVELSGSSFAASASPDEVFEVGARIDNHLAGGRYLVACRVDRRSADEVDEPVPVSPAKVVRFTVAGPIGRGIVAPRVDFLAGDPGQRECRP